MFKRILSIARKLTALTGGQPYETGETEGRASLIASVGRTPYGYELSIGPVQGWCEEWQWVESSGGAERHCSFGPFKWTE